MSVYEQGYWKGRVLFTFLSYPYMHCCLSTSLADLEILINCTLVSLAATVRTDPDRTVVIATLESTDDLLRSLKSTSFVLTGKALESLMVSLQDILECKVRLALCCSYLQFVVIFFLSSQAQCQEGTDEEEGLVGNDEMVTKILANVQLLLPSPSTTLSLCYFSLLSPLFPKG